MTITRMLAALVMMAWAAVALAVDAGADREGPLVQLGDEGSRAQTALALEQLRKMPALVAADAARTKAEAMLEPGKMGPADLFAQPLGKFVRGFEKIDEPGGSLALNVNPSLACPGFFVMSVGDGPDPGNVPGSYGAELLLQQPGSRLLQGGLNFGGSFDASAPGFAAFTIANPANENQQVNLSVTGFTPRSGNPNVRARIVLERRLPTQGIVFSQVVTLSQNTPFNTSAVVSPGFYVVNVEAVDTITGADGVFFMSALTSFIGRPGGGFQGGVVVGGYHDPNASNVPGFAGFCIADPHTVTMRTEGRPTRGPAGAGDLRLVLANADNQVLFANPAQAGSGDDHGNTCSSATAVSTNSQFSGAINPANDLDFFRFTLASASRVIITSASNIDLIGTLYNNDGSCATVVAEDDDGAGPGSVQFRIDVNLAAGTYFLRVRNFGAQQTGNYTISLTGGTPGDDHGNTCSAATGVTLNTSVAGVINPASDVDFFRFTLPSTSQVVLQSSSSIDLVGTLYNNDGTCNTVVAEDDDGAGNLQFRIAGTLGAGTYFLRVRNFAAAATGSYTVSFSASTGGGVQASLDVRNRLLYPVAITVNGAAAGVVAADTTARINYSGGSSVALDWAMIRPTLGGVPLGDAMSGSFNPVSVSQGQIVNFTIDAEIANQRYFFPLINNSTGARLLMGANVGVASQNLCNCVALPFSQTNFGYYRLFSNSNVRAYRDGSGYTGPFVFWDGFSALVNPDSGFIQLNANSAP